MILNKQPLSSINSRKTYLLHEAYSDIKERADQVLDKYPEYPELIKFNNRKKSVTFITEKLIPVLPTNRPRVMFLFSNPHPHSVHQAMFLSPNTRGRENLFWRVMEEAGWLPIPKENRKPRHLADICLEANYPGPFEFIFYCYYAFPTEFPEEIRKIFGRMYFNQSIEPEAIDEFKTTVQETSVQSVVAFNKGIFNLVSNNPVEKYVERLKKGELIQSQIKGMDRDIPIFLTFPTGWRFHRRFMHFRKASLDEIHRAILNKSHAAESKQA